MRNYLQTSRLIKVIAITTLVASLFGGSVAFAASSGPNGGTSFSSVSEVFGDYSWSHPSNAETSDSSYATSDITDSNNPTQYLEATGFGFNIPSNATVNGISVTVQRYQTCDISCTTSAVTDNVIQLIKGGTPSGTNEASNTSWPTSDTNATYGGSSSLWGLTLTPTVVNSSNFGVAVSAQRSIGGSRTASVNYISVTVSYTASVSNQTITVTTAAPSSATYNSTFPVAATASSGLAVAITTSGGCSGSGNSSTTITMTSGITACTVDFNQAGNGSYNAAPQVAETTNANLANQTALTVVLPTSVVYEQAGITASTSGGKGTGAVTFNSASSTACSVNSSTGALTITSGTGICSITATKAADSNYNATTSSAVSMTINKATQAALNVTGLPASAVYGQAGITAGTSGGSSTGTVTFSAGSSTACSIDPSAGTVSITNSTGTCSIIATKAADSNYNSATSSAVSITIGKATLTVTGITASDKPYDGTTAATLNVSGATLVGGTGVSLDTSGAVGTFSDKNVGTGKIVTISGLTLTGSSTSDYVLTQPTTTANITAIALTISGVTANNKIYDATTDATLSGTSTLVGVVASDTVILGGSPIANFSDKNVANGKSVIVSGYSISGADSSNYTLTQPALTANITPANLTVSATGVDKVYDGTTNATVNYLTDKIGTDVVTPSGSATFSDKNVGNGKTITVTGITLGGTDSGNYTLLNTTTTATANITPANLTVSATGVDKVYDGTTNATVTLSDNEVAGDGLTDSYTSASFGDKNVGNGKLVTVTGISVSGAELSNYTVTNTTATTTADITQYSLNVTATGINKVYDGTTDATVLLATNALAGDNVVATDTSAAFATSTVGAAIPISVSGISLTGTDAANYSCNTTANATADIVQNSAAITLDTSNLTRTYDDTPQSVDVLSVNPAVSYQVTYNGSLTPPTDGGTYDVVAAITDPNYAGTDSATLTINPITATVSVTGYNVTYDGNIHTATGTATGLAGALPSSDFDFSGTAHTSAGTYNGDVWVFNGGADYDSASGTVNDLINQATSTLSVTNTPVAYNGAPQTATVTSTVPGIITNVLVDGAANQTDVGSYPVTADFAPTDSTDYESLSGASAGDFVIASSTDDLITAFGFGTAGETDTIVSNTIAVTVPSGTDVTNLTPNISVSSGATVSPLSGVTQDFTNPVLYTVTAQDGVTTQQYTVTVTVSSSPAPVVTSGGGGGAPTYTITSSAGANGSINPLGLVNESPNSNQTFTINPNTGYQIANVLVDGNSEGAVGTYTFNSVVANHTISATFSPIVTNQSGNSTSTVPQGQVLGASTSTIPQGQVLGTSTFFFANNLGFGMDSNDVKQLQIRLTDEGEFTGPITGYFGKLTFAAVKEYQTNHGVILITGYVGVITRGILNGILSSNPTPEQQLAYVQSQLANLQQ